MSDWPEPLPIVAMRQVLNRYRAEHDGNDRDMLSDIFRAWFRSQGVLCDCDNGVRYLDDGNPGLVEPCDRCVLVEVGGIRVRADKDALTDGTGPHYEPELLLTVVKVTDE